MVRTSPSSEKHATPHTEVFNMLILAIDCGHMKNQKASSIHILLCVNLYLHDMLQWHIPYQRGDIIVCAVIGDGDTHDL